MVFAKALPDSRAESNPDFEGQSSVKDRVVYCAAMYDSAGTWMIRNSQVYFDPIVLEGENGQNSVVKSFGASGVVSATSADALYRATQNTLTAQVNLLKA